MIIYIIKHLTNFYCIRPYQDPHPQMSIRLRFEQVKIGLVHFLQLLSYSYIQNSIRKEMLSEFYEQYLSRRVVYCIAFFQNVLLFPLSIEVAT